MTGQDRLIAMRRAGRKPAFVWVTDLPVQHLDGLTVRVHGDTPELLDLRFLVGVTAIVEGTDPKRVDRIAKACAQHARRVIASTHGPRDVERVTDTEGILTWQA